MFENIIGQKAVVSSLIKAVRERTLPHSLLFYGPQYSGKLSAALELGRVLTCEADAEWKCACTSCRKQRLLVHPDQLLLGTREFDAEISACADAVRRIKKQSVQFLFLRAVRKLLRRFDPVLWEGDESKMRQVYQTVTEVEELADGFTRRIDAQVFDHPEKEIKKIVELSGKLSASLKSDNIPIGHVRRAIAWSHLTSAGRSKIIIMENADRMLESSRNSLLKILEEPPVHVYLVLISSRKDAMIRTVLSRLRTFSFLERNATEDADILRRVFQEETPEFKNIHDYFLAWKDVNPVMIRTLSSRFIELLLDDTRNEVDVLEEMDGLFPAKSDRAMFPAFTQELFLRFREILAQPGLSSDIVLRLDAWTRLVNQAVSSVENFNLNPKNVLLGLYYGMRAAA